MRDYKGLERMKREIRLRQREGRKMFQTGVNFVDQIDQNCKKASNKTAVGVVRVT